MIRRLSAAYANESYVEYQRPKFPLIQSKSRLPVEPVTRQVPPEILSFKNNNIHANEIKSAAGTAAGAEGE